jgi:hypothetical protein
MLSESDKISHIDMKDDHIDTVISHIDTVIFRSSSLSIPSAKGRLPYRYSHLFILWTGLPDHILSLYSQHVPPHVHQCGDRGRGDPRGGAHRSTPPGRRAHVVLVPLPVLVLGPTPHPTQF